MKMEISTQKDGRKNALIQIPSTIPLEKTIEPSSQTVSQPPY